MAAIEAVVFDFYETLVEQSPGFRDRVFDDIARRAGVELAQGAGYQDWRELAASDSAVRLGGMRRLPLDGERPPFVTFRERWTRRATEMFAKWGTDAPPELAAEIYRDAHRAAALYPEVMPVLEELSGRYRLAVLSDADDDFILPCIERGRLSFETVVTSEELRTYKPHVTMFREICRRLGVDPSQAAYVGDSPWLDVAGSRNAGMQSIWVNRHDTAWPDDIDPPPATVTSLDQLPATLSA